MSGTIDEILSEIREAELRADAIQQDAYQQAKEIVLQAELEAEKQKKDTLKSCKEDQRKAIATAEEKAKERRSRILKKGEQQAEDMEEEYSARIEEVADKVVDILIEKYCKQA